MSYLITSYLRRRRTLPRGDYEGAIQRFREDPNVKVLLLHAGTAAAGLTLTQADLVVLLVRLALCTSRYYCASKHPINNSQYGPWTEPLLHHPAETHPQPTPSPVASATRN